MRSSRMCLNGHRCVFLFWHLDSFKIPAHTICINLVDTVVNIKEVTHELLYEVTPKMLLCCTLRLKWKSSLVHTYSVFYIVVNHSPLSIIHCFAHSFLNGRVCATIH